MKAILEFDLDDHEEKRQMQNCLDADKMRGFIDSIHTDFFRPYLKYGVSITDKEKEISPDEIDVLQTLFEKMQSAIDGLGLKNEE